MILELSTRAPSAMQATFTDKLAHNCPFSAAHRSCYNNKSAASVFMKRYMYRENTVQLECGVGGGGEVCTSSLRLEVTLSVNALQTEKNDELKKM
jgi:hypothetical protein